jgi:hypothetical protein
MNEKQAELQAFAAAALQGLLAGQHRTPTTSRDEQRLLDDVAERAWAYAEAMVRARKVRASGTANKEE